MQRFGVQWLGEEDRNTKVFHYRASERRKKNTIVRLWNENGSWCNDKNSIAATVISYLEDIYSTTFPIRVSEVTNLFQSKSQMRLMKILFELLQGKK